MSDEVPAVDFTQIKFPSDQLTIGQLRRLYPYSFDLSKWREGEAVGALNTWPYGRGGMQELDSVIDNERRVASVAFKQAIGQPLTVWYERQPLPEMIEALANFYEELGLATGEHHAQQLVRDIVTQATTQAKKHFPNKRR